jgi:hypothetical protein
MKRNSRSTAEWRTAEITRLRQKFEPYLAEYLIEHDNGDAEAIGKAFVTAHPELLAEFAQLFVADLLKQRKLPFQI